MDIKNLKSLSSSQKIVVTCFVVTIMLGYLVAVMKIFDHNHLDLEKTLIYYRGAETGEDVGIILPPSFSTLLSVAHNHMFSQPVMLFLMGILFTFTYMSQKSKSLFILLSFVGSLLSNASPWLIRYVSSKTVMLLPFSQMLMMSSFFVMGFVVLYDIWGKTIHNDD